MKKEGYQFKVACVPYLKLLQSKALKKKIDECFPQKIDF